MTERPIVSGRDVRARGATGPAGSSRRCNITMAEGPGMGL